MGLFSFFFNYWKPDYWKKCLQGEMVESLTHAFAVSPSWPIICSNMLHPSCEILHKVDVSCICMYHML